jgi:hypothetical protein
MPIKKEDKCNCEWCKMYDRLMLARDHGDVHELIELADDLFEVWSHTRDDLAYLQCIFDGSWPSAVEQLEEALAKAKTIREKKNDKRTVQTSNK